MDYAQLADQNINRAEDRKLGHGLGPMECATIDALTGIGYALLHLAETVARPEQ